jgi:hypothetical protein
MKVEQAKELFFYHTGSHFYMSRNGEDVEYRKAGISRETELAWLEELTRIRLNALSKPANWTVVNFLIHHGKYGHLADVALAEPKGVLGERYLFLDFLLKYARGCGEAGGDPALIKLAAQKVIIEARHLLRKARSERSVQHIHDIMVLAKRLGRGVTVTSVKRLGLGR